MLSDSVGEGKITATRRGLPWWLAQRVKNLPAFQDTWLQSLGHEDPLEKEMATHSSILAWRIPWTEEPGRLQSIESQRVRMTKQLTHIQQGYDTVRK